MNIGIIGFGGVAKAFIKLVNDKKDYLSERNLDINIKYIIRKSGGIYNREGINLEELISSNFDLNIFNFKENMDINYILKNKDIDTIVELTNTNIEDGEPGLTHIKLALNNNINVVTGNKGPIVLQYKELKEIADKNKLRLEIGCTTGGALPTINVGSYDIAGSEILEIQGILNGTSNYILSEMYEKNLSYKEILKKAIDSGIAEANYKLDVEGFDTACKILILANSLMNSNLTLNDLDIKGIDNIDIDFINKEKNKGNKIKLIGKVYKENQKIKAYVRPEVIKIDHPLYFIDGKNKGVLYKTDTLGDISIIGGESGTRNAAASILRDIINMDKRE